MKLSAVVITFNEEKNIERCIQSMIPVADEIVVVDSNSTDKTREICERLKVNFYVHPFEGYVQQKNYAMSLASYDYVLSLDADEELSNELTQSITREKSTGFKSEAYEFNRLTNYCGQWIHHCGWYPDRKIRLWHKGKGKWSGINPHDRVEMDFKIKAARLNGDILHYSYNSLSDHLKQMDKFSTIAASEAFARKKSSSTLVHLVIYPFFTFLKLYVIKLGFLDGYGGFLVCVSGAYYRFLKYAKLKELLKNKT